MIGSVSGDFLVAVAEVLNWIFNALQLVIFVSVVLSWVNADPYNGLVRMIRLISEPILAPFRRIVPPWRLNGLDISPILAFLTLLFAQRFLVAALYDIALKLK